MDNRRIATALDAWADALEAEGAGRFRVAAYRRAADEIARSSASVATMAQEGRDLTSIRGVGASIAKRIETLLREGIPDTLTAEGTHLLRGDLHAHTTATDGRHSITAMAAAAAARGYEYLAITDHSKTTRIAGGLSEEAMRKHLDRIRRASDEAPLELLAGAEVDILKDGGLDYPDALLADMDVVVCSVHFRYGMDGRAQTERILAGMSNEHAHILAHPTARRSGIRPGMDLDLPRILDAARDGGWAVEMNGSPERLDLGAAEAPLAIERGVLLALDSDAHATHELRQADNAVRQARQAGVPDEQVLNAKPLDALRDWLA